MQLCPIIKKFYCNQNFTSQQLTSFATYQKATTIGAKYKLNRIEWVNIPEKYVRFSAISDGNPFIIKMFLRKNL